VKAGDGYDEIEKAMDYAHHKAGSRKKLPRTREDLGDFDASISLGHTSPVSKSPVCSLLRFWLQFLVG
jgi:hypothetical protein